MVEEVQEGDAPAEHAEHWKAPEIVKPAFNYTALRKASIAWDPSSRDKLELMQKFLSGIYH